MSKVSTSSQMSIETPNSLPVYPSFVPSRDHVPIVRPTGIKSYDVAPVRPVIPPKPQRPRSELVQWPPRKSTVFVGEELGNVPEEEHPADHVCERCDEQLASFYCIQCVTYFCAQCSTELHGTGEWQKHTMYDAN